jgi:pimeloyl-ACP methyl ester carboxylesterase
MAKVQKINFKILIEHQTLMHYTLHNRGCALCFLCFCLCLSIYAGEELMPRSIDHVPLTAYRYASLNDRLGDDDMFSNDLTDTELESRLGHVTIPTALVFSLKDEYVPKHVQIPELAHRIAAAISKGPTRPAALLVDGANHALSEASHAIEFADFVINFLRTVSL